VVKEVIAAFYKKIHVDVPQTKPELSHAKKNWKIKNMSISLFNL
jgi:hypothetical protein